MLKITQDRKRKYTSTGVRLKPTDWHAGNQKVRKSHPNYNKLNQELDIIRESAAQAYRELDREKKASADAIKKRLIYSSKDNFFELSEDYLKGIKAESYYNWKQSTVAVKKLKNFHGSKHLPVNSIDKDLLDGFVRYLQYDLNNKASTILKNFNPIRNILDVAVKQRLITENPAKTEDFVLPKVKNPTKKPTLSMAQIKQMEDLPLDPESNRWHSRNAFVLSFYFCGIRFGDLANLRWKNVKRGRLQYTMSKTDTDIDVKYPEQAYRVLFRYVDTPGDYLAIGKWQGEGWYYLKNNEGHSTALAKTVVESFVKAQPNSFIFPFLSDLNKRQQKNAETIRRRISSWNAIINGQDSGGKVSGLKRIAKDLEWDVNLSMHVARHSFSQYAVEVKEVPVYRMMILLGHQNIKTTMNYLKKINVKAADEAIDAIF